MWVIALSACGTLSATSVDKKSDPAPVDSSVVQSLQRQVRERDKRIAELESQLDALKVIDQDMEQRIKSSRSPATLTPAATGQFPYPTFRVLPRYQELDARIHARANGRRTPRVMPDTRAVLTPEICLSDFIQGDGRNPILLGTVSYEPMGGGNCS